MAVWCLSPGLGQGRFLLKLIYQAHNPGLGQGVLEYWSDGFDVGFVLRVMGYELRVGLQIRLLTRNPQLGTRNCQRTLLYSSIFLDHVCNITNK
jgi:hypothetical protein